MAIFWERAAHSVDHVLYKKCILTICILVISRFGFEGWSLGSDCFSSLVQFIFYFWSFEISRNILRNQKTLSVKIRIF